MNVQIREVISFLDSYLSSGKKQNHDLYKGLEKFTREELMNFLQSMGWVMDWYFDTKKDIENYFSSKPKDFQDIFVSTLRVKRSVENKMIDQFFAKARAGKTLDSELKLKLDNLTMDVEVNPTAEQLGALRKNFPTGNYLFHTTDLRSAVMIMEDRMIITAEENTRGKKRDWTPKAVRVSGLI